MRKIFPNTISPADTFEFYRKNFGPNRNRPVIVFELFDSGIEYGVIDVDTEAESVSFIYIDKKQFFDKGELYAVERNIINIVDKLSKNFVPTLDQMLTSATRSSVGKVTERMSEVVSTYYRELSGLKDLELELQKLEEGYHGDSFESTVYDTIFPAYLRSVTHEGSLILKRCSEINTLPISINSLGQSYLGLNEYFIRRFGIDDGIDQNNLTSQLYANTSGEFVLRDKPFLLHEGSNPVHVMVDNDFLFYSDIETIKPGTDEYKTALSLLKNAGFRHVGNN